MIVDIVAARNAAFVKLLSFKILEYCQYFWIFGRNMFSAPHSAAWIGCDIIFPQMVYFFLLWEGAVFAIIAL